MSLLVPMSGMAQRTHTVFHEGSDHELHVYRIYGRQEGKTLLLIGGIQGDEPGGFLSADSYADMALAKGNLIVVPRANFQSILLQKRRINEDMNRQFEAEEVSTYERKIVQILKQLIAESDCLLNLHDGSGFYCGEWISDLRNPKRYGQSIIADYETYTVPGTDQMLQLGAMGRRVAERINRKIEDPDHYFHFNNHRTDASDTLHREQRKSATYYALKHCGIPAFGVETSKSLPLSDKIRHHNLAINAFMEELDILPETPGVKLDPPQLNYIVVRVGNMLPMVVENQQVLHVEPGDEITVLSINANYIRGLSADILDAGGVNDFRQPVVVQAPTRIVIRKDHYPCGSVYLSPGQRAASTGGLVTDAPETGGWMMLRMEVNGEKRILENYDAIEVVRGDRIELLDLICPGRDPSHMEVNFKGFVGNRSLNTGEDRGYVIHTGADLWPRYSVNGDGKEYPVVVEYQDREVGRFSVRIKEPLIRYLVVDTGSGRQFVKPDDRLDLRSSNGLTLVEVVGNLPDNEVSAILCGPGKAEERLEKAVSVSLVDWRQFSGKGSSDSIRVLLKRGSLLMGTVFLSL